MPADPAALDQIVKDLLPLGALDADGPMYAGDWNSLVRAVAALAVQLGASPVEFPAPGAVPRPAPPSSSEQTLLARLNDLDERMARLQRGAGLAGEVSADDDVIADVVSDARLDGIEAEVSSLGQKIVAVSTSLDARFRAIETGFASRLLGVEEEVRRLGKVVDRLGAQVEGAASAAVVEKRLGELENAVHKLMAIVSSGGGGNTTSPDTRVFTDRMDLLEKLVDGRLQKVESTTSRYDTLFKDVDGRFSKAELSLASAIREAGAAKTEAESASSAAGAAKSAADAASASAEGASRKFSELQATVVTQNSTLESLRSGLSAASSRTLAIEKKVGALSTDTSSLQASVESITKDVSGLTALNLSTRVTSLETDTTALKTDTRTLKTDTAALKSDTTALKADTLTLSKKAAIDSSTLRIVTDLR